MAIDLKKFEGCVSEHEFIWGLMLSSRCENTPGHYWESTVTCQHCLFAKSCALIREAVPLDKKINCRDIINLLLGEITAEKFQ